jgi:hypothetical protein
VDVDDDVVDVVELVELVELLEDVALVELVAPLDEDPPPPHAVSNAAVRPATPSMSASDQDLNIPKPPPTRGCSAPRKLGLG